MAGTYDLDRSIAEHLGYRDITLETFYYDDSLDAGQVDRLRGYLKGSLIWVPQWSTSANDALELLKQVEGEIEITRTGYGNWLVRVNQMWGVGSSLPVAICELWLKVQK